jgi:hypothetical protein
MCYTCGCRRPYDTMGGAKNIVEKFFEEAGQTAAIGKAGVLQAKKHKLELLQAELEKQELEKPKGSIDFQDFSLSEVPFL